MRVLRDKKVLITGAASGIGRALALRFAHEGCHLFLLDINEAGVQAVASEARAAGVDAHPHRCDVARPEQITASTQAVLARWGTLDVLVNNAGVCYYGPTVRMTPRQWDWLMAVNLLAPIQFTRELLPTLLSRPEAHVLNVASMYGFITTPRCAAYHTTKFGLIGLSEALRMEFGRQRLGVTALCPGFTQTGLFENMPRGRQDQPVRQPPRWLCTTPERVARKAVAAVYRDRRLALVTPLAHCLYHLKRFAPGLLDWAACLGRRRAMNTEPPRILAEPTERARPFEEAPSPPSVTNGRRSGKQAA